MKGMAIYSSILARKIPLTEEPGGCSPWCRRESVTPEQLSTYSTECQHTETRSAQADDIENEKRNTLQVIRYEKR